MKIALLRCVILVFIVFVTTNIAWSAASGQCKELNQVNCHLAKNDGISCNSKDETKMEARWWYDKGVCRKFSYKGCNGNRNRFCTKEACEHRCIRERN